MNETLVVYCTPILDCPKDDGNTAAETTSDKMVVGAVRALGESSLLVSKQNHSNLFLTALDDALKGSFNKMGDFCELNMLKSVKAKVDEQLARESHQL